MGVEEPFRITTSRVSECVVLELEGELDLLNAPLLEGRLAEDNVRQAPVLVLDLRRLSFTDSSGLRVIFAARNEAHERGQRFAITESTEQVRRLLAVTHLADQFETVASPEEACA
jgi:anti-sigma B factor antagonist